MAIIFSTEQAAAEFDQVCERVGENNETILIDRGEKVGVAPVSFALLQEVEDYELQEHVQAKRLEELIALSSIRDRDLSDDEAMELAVNAVREVRAERVAERRQAFIEGKMIPIHSV